MEKDNYLLINSKILPPVFKCVLQAKEMLANGTAPNASQAAKMAGISRSAFYKYKDFVFAYDAYNNTLNLSAVLSDRAGVFSAMTAVLYENGANIITVNQSTPVNGSATVTLTIRTEDVKVTMDSLLQQLLTVDGVLSVKTL